MPLPRAMEPFVRFAHTLRQAGFPVAPDQTIGFVEGVGLLGPRDMNDIFRTGRALFAIPPERFPEYEALFHAVFMDQIVQAPATASEDEPVEAFEPTGSSTDVEVTEDTSEVGAEAAHTERLGQRALSDMADTEVLAHLRRTAPQALPRRLSYRRRSQRHGDRLDMRRTLREAARRDGDVLRLHQTARKTRQRRIVMLVDVSGSMKDRSDSAMQLAHTLVQAADRVEVFTLGTRLTRITHALRPADRAQALDRVATAVADFDGGTRIGEALAAFLAVPRYAGFARGAAVVVLSDGLERGGPEAMTEAVTRLSRIAWRLDWLSPLAADPDYRPRTEALARILPHLDSLSDGASPAAIVRHLLTMAHHGKKRA